MSITDKMKNDGYNVQTFCNDAFKMGMEKIRNQTMVAVPPCFRMNIFNHDSCGALFNIHA